MTRMSPENYVPSKTVLFRIISIVRVPSLCFNKDTHDNFDDEVECFSLSVKLESTASARIRSSLWWTFHLSISDGLEERSATWEVPFIRKKLHATSFKNTFVRVAKLARGFEPALDTSSINIMLIVVTGSNPPVSFEILMNKKSS